MAFDNLKNVEWGATGKLILARGFASAIVLTLVGAFLGAFTQSGVGGAVQFIVTWTFVGALAVLFYMGVFAAIDATLGRAVGIVTLVTAIMRFIVIGLVAIGDPLVYLLNQKLSQLLAVTDFKLFNLVAVIFVYKPDEGTFADRLQ